MSRILQFILFFTVFFGLYVSLNSYVILRLGGLLGIKRVFLFYAIAFVTLGLPVTMFVENRLPNIFTRIAYTISALWMGILLFLFCTLIIYEIIRPFYAVPYAGFIILGIVSLLSIYSMINALQLSVNEVVVPVGVEKEVKIVQLSDLHVGTIRNSRFLMNVAAKVNEIDPDIVMITGDLVDAAAPLHKSMFSGFNKLRAPVFFVSGNHETYEDIDMIYKLLNDTKITVLKNEVVTWDGIQVVGVEFSQDKAYLGKVLSGLKINQSKPAVLMYHPPMSMEDAKKAGIDLQLSGHTHDGQIYPFNFFVWLVFRHIRGLYDLDGIYLHVSPGTGTWGPYMRLGSRNEITVIRLVK